MFSSKNEIPIQLEVNLSISSFKKNVILTDEDQKLKLKVERVTST